jgi:hypothetical protein
MLKRVAVSVVAVMVAACGPAEAGETEILRRAYVGCAGGDRPSCETLVEVSEVGSADWMFGLEELRGLG